MTTTVLAAALLLQAQAPPITFETRAARLSEILVELSAKANVKLEAVPAVANDVLVISVKDVPLDVLLTKIAAATSSEWKADGDVRRLALSQVAINRENQEDRARRLKSMQTSLAERVKSAVPAPAGEEDPMTMRFASDPEKAITRLLQGIDLLPIAMLGGNERIVYSTNPTQMQRPMHASARQVIVDLVAGHNKRISSTPRPIPGEEEQKMMDAMPKFVRDMIEQQSKPIQNPSKALLVASRMDMGMFASTTLELRIYDEQGKTAFSHSSALGDMSAMMAAMTPKTSEATTEKTTPDTPVKYSEDSKLLQTSLGGFTAGGMNIKVDPKIRALLATPDKVDPLSFMATDELTSLAKSKSKALVANVPDAFMSTMNMFVAGGTQTVQEVEAGFETSEDAVLSETEGWVIVKPRQPIRSRANRVDRAGLAALVRASDAKGLPDLDDIARFSLTSPSPMENGIGQLYSMLVVPGLMNFGLSGMTDWNAYRIYGTLTTGQRQNLAEGGRIPHGSLSSQQKDLWRTMLFGTLGAIQVGEENPEFGFTQMTMGMMGNLGGDFRQEPTELMPKGVPADALMSMASVSQPFANPIGEGGEAVPGYLGVLGLDELAMMRMFKSDPNMAEVSAFMPNLDRLRVGARTVHTLRLDLPQQAHAKQVLMNNKVDKNAPVVGMSNLPPDFEKQLQARLEVLKKSPFGMIGSMMGGMGGTIKP